MSTPGRPGSPRPTPSPPPQHRRPTPHLPSRPASAHAILIRASLSPFPDVHWLVPFSPMPPPKSSQLLSSRAEVVTACFLSLYQSRNALMARSCLHARGSLSLALLEVTQPAPCPRMAVPGYFLASLLPLVLPS